MTEDVFSTSVFSSSTCEKINYFLNRYETKRSAIIPILHVIQDTDGWVQEKHIDALEKDYGLHRVHVREVLTFYTAFHREAPRPFHIQFCDNLVCCMVGAKEVMEKIRQRIENHEKQTGKPSPFGLRGVPCLGWCGEAPAMLVNKERHLNLTPDNIDAVLDQYNLAQK